MLSEFHIGIDDTDSLLSGCTTFTAAVIFEELVDRGFSPLGFPWLIRLNPNIPWKTRGNAALSLHFSLEDGQLDEVKEIAVAIVERTSDVSQEKTDPAIVFLKGPVPPSVHEFYQRALHDVLSVGEARRVATSARTENRLFKGSQGLVGALASIGAILGRDHTYEIIAYRTPENVGTTRRVDLDSIREMDSKFGGWTFNNIDLETGRVLICPHGPDPVLLGIRGADPIMIKRAFDQVQVDEPIERFTIFKSNQGTGAHLDCRRRIGELRPYQSTVVTGKTCGTPQLIRGGHVIFQVRDETGCIDCAAYRSTGKVRDAASKLIPGDSVVVSGGVRPRLPGRMTLNVEVLEVTELVDAIRLTNPPCSICGAGCESMGKGQGFRCRKCGARLPRTSAVRKIAPRNITKGIYLPPFRANRHLSRPNLKEPNSLLLSDMN